MKVPLSWLKNYVPLPTESELFFRLTEIGHMVDGVTRLPDNQTVVSLEIRQNRPDCLSILGIAREVGAAFKTPVQDVSLAELPRVIHSSAAPAAAGGRSVPPESDYVCFLRIKDARLDHLPDKMLEMLEQYGQDSVNPFVDLSNYVMVELGQPLHVYDASNLDIAFAQSRLARDGESLTLLNGEMVLLSEDDLIIADSARPLALAGVMGGDAVKVVGTRGDIIVEAGNFRSELVRRTARRHGLATEASLRCSKLLAPQLVPVALQRFLALLLQYGEAGELELWQEGSLLGRLKSYGTPIELDCRDIERISGVRVSPEESAAILVSLRFADVELIQDGKIAAIPPWWRTDIEHAADLIEEVLRIYGYSKIPLERLAGEQLCVDPDNTWEQEEAVRNLLCAWGYDEAILDAFLLDNVGGLEERRDILRVENPPAGSRDVLRPSLVPNLLSASRFLPLVIPQRRLFEIGHTFFSLEGQPTERRTVAWTTMQGNGPSSWYTACSPDFYTLKAEAEAMLATLGVRVTSNSSKTIPFPFLAGKSCCLLDSSGQIAGYVGEVDHQEYNLKPGRKSFAVEIYLPAPSLRQEKRARTPRREVDSFDISLLANKDTKAAAIQELVGEMLGQDLVTMRLIDVYQGKQLQANSQSFTFRIVYARSRGEPNRIWREVGNGITQRLHAEVRGANQ